MNVVTHPKHYNAGKIEVIEFIEDQDLNYHRGQVVKYVSRAGKKDPDKTLEDLEKAAWYLAREIELLKAEDEARDPKRPNDMNPKTRPAIGVLLPFQTEELVKAGVKTAAHACDYVNNVLRACGVLP